MIESYSLTDAKYLWMKSKGEHQYFVKLMMKLLDDTRVMETLRVPMKWDNDNADDELKNLVVADGIVNLF